jgi:hypothetical protein
VNAVDSVQAPASSPASTEPAHVSSVSAPVSPARWLRICVTRRNRMVVQVCFPSYAVLSLADLVPDDARTQIIAGQVDLENVAANAASLGCPVGELFAVKSGEHGVRAWLD